MNEIKRLLRQIENVHLRQALRDAIQCELDTMTVASDPQMVFAQAQQIVTLERRISDYHNLLQKQIGSIPPTPHMVFTALADIANGADFIIVSDQTIQQHLNISDQNLRHCYQVLEDAGYITWSRGTPESREIWLSTVATEIA